MIWKLIFLPGYLFLWLNYYLPIEWGKDRNVTTFGRQFRKNPAVWSAIYSIIFYGALFVLYSE